MSVEQTTLDDAIISDTTPTTAGASEVTTPSQESTTAIQPTPPVLALATKLPEWGVGDSWLAEFERMAVRLAKATVLPDALKGSPQNILAVALAGRELGIGFMEATRQIDIINGATALRSELKMALAKRAGMVVDDVKASATGCAITAHRTDTGETLTVSFTEADKKLAKLSTDPASAWTKYPEDMMYARAAARLIRRLMPDARGASFRTTEEITDEPSGTGYDD